MAEMTYEVKNVSFDVRIDPPSHLDGPTMGFMLNYQIKPFALIHVRARGELVLAGGQRPWELGLIQNWHAELSEMIYDHGGKVQWRSSTPYLDKNSPGADIWFDPVGFPKDSWHNCKSGGKPAE
jgi:hypothetical protein